jgi:hypothetical protein
MEPSLRLGTPLAGVHDAGRVRGRQGHLITFLACVRRVVQVANAYPCLADAEGVDQAQGEPIFARMDCIYALPCRVYSLNRTN